MKLLFTLIITLLCVVLKADNSDPVNISLDKHYKVVNTFSGNTYGDNSFHLILAKNKKTSAYDIIPFHYVDKELVRLSSISFSKRPRRLLSFHNNEGILSLFMGFYNDLGLESIRIVDIDLDSGDNKKSSKISGKRFRSSITKKDITHLLFSTKNSIEVINLKNLREADTIIVKPNKSSKGFIKSLPKDGVIAVNKEEFVANGPTSIFRAYAENGLITITKDSYKKRQVEVIQIPFNNGSEFEVNAQTFSYVPQRDLRKSTSHIHKDKLYMLGLSKREIKLSIHDLANRSIYFMDLENMEPLHKGEAFKNIKSFLKEAASYNNSPTITVNDTDKGNVKVRIDYVDKVFYDYSPNWWWWHHDMLYMQMIRNSQINNSVRGFGPFPPNDIYFISEEKEYFEFILDGSNNIVQSMDEETIYKDIDEKSYIEELDENRKLSYTSTVFIDGHLRNISYDKETKSLNLLERELND